MSVPADIVALGLVVGMLYALLALGFVIVYKSTRVLNMAHGDIGGFGSILLVWLVFRWSLGFWPAFGVSIVAGALVGVWVERAFVDRLRNAPRVVLLVVTLGIAQLITAVNTLIVSPTQQAQLVRGNYPEPFSFHPTILGARLRPATLLTLILVPLVAAALGAFFRYHRFGVAMRAVAENADNARLLGVSARRVSLAAWALGGGLSATAAVLIGAVSGTAFNLGVGPGLLTRALAGAMAARLLSLPKAAVWGLGIGLFEQVVLFNTGGRTGIVDAILLGFILAVLLVQRRARGRAGELEESSWPVAQALRTLPRALAEGDLNRRLRTAMPAALIVAAAVLPWVVSAARTLLLIRVIAFAIAGLSLVILTGFGGQISLGQWAVAGVAAFASARLDVSAGWPQWSIPVAAVLVGSVTALVVGLPALRLRGLFLAVTTLAFAVAASSYLFGEQWFTGGQQGITPARPHLIAGDRAFYLAALVALAVAMLAARQASRGRLGRHIAAVRENERAAAAMAINVMATKLTTFALSGAVAGLAGWVFIYGGGIGNVESFLAPESLRIVALTVVGGIGSVFGPVVGSALVIGLPGFFPGQAFLAAFGTAIGVLQVLLHLPAGLVSLPLKLRDAIVREPEPIETAEAA